MSPEEVRADRGKKKPKPVQEPLPILYSDLQHGKTLSFWEDELRIDLAQEYVALNAQGIRGKDRQQYLAAYRTREVNEAKFFLSVDTIPYAAMERAYPIESSGRNRASPGERTPAICHEGRVAVSHDLCEACFAFAQRARAALRKGAITDDEARERVRKRLKRIVNNDTPLLGDNHQ